MKNWIKLERDNFIEDIECNGLCGLLIEESEELSKESLKAIRQWLRHCYADNEEIQAEIESGFCNNEDEYYKKSKFPSQDNLIIKSGDFGEAIGHFILENHPNFKYRIPVFKLRYKPNKERSLFGVDSMGFLFKEDDGINALCINEIKSATTQIKNVLNKGCKQLLEETDTEREFSQVARIAHYLRRETKNEEADKLARFGMGKAKVDFERKYVFLGLIDNTQSLEETIAKLTENVELCNLLKTKDFKFILFPIKNYREKLLKAYE